MQIIIARNISHINVAHIVIHKTVKETLSKIQLFFVQRKKLYSVVSFFF